MKKIICKNTAFKSISPLNIGTCAVFVLLIILTFIMLKKGSSDTEKYERSGFYFDTLISITIYGNPSSERDAEAVLDDCFSLCAHYEGLFSRTKEGSDIYRINNAGGSPVMVDKETACLIEHALYYAKISGGAVSPAVGSLSTLWNIGSSRDNTVPSEKEINEARKHTDYTKIKINDTTVILEDADMRLDLGFIAKGYVADRLKEKLLSYGISSALINLGGNVLAIGKKPDGKSFNIGIRDPLSEHMTDTITILSAEDESIVSSGSYERYFIKDNIRYHHILDLKSGYPAESGLLQVTIKAPSSEEADALSTICFILGYDEATKLISESFPDAEAIFVNTDGKIIR